MTSRQELIDGVRSGYAVLSSSGEWPADGLLAEGFEVHQDRFIDTARVFRGPGAPGELMRTLAQSFSEITLELDTVLEAPDGRLVATVAVRGRGAASGIAIDKRQAHVWSFSNGEATTMQIHGQPAEALKAVGLEA
jgi:ketosteroid isomerase-like protein